MSIQPDKVYVPLCIPEIGGNEWAYIKECLDTNWVSSVGSYVFRFEKEFASTVGAQFAVATSSGTAALHLSLVASRIEAGAEVITSDLTFVAPANAIRYVGAWPVFVDACPRTWQMDVDKLEDFLRRGCTRESAGLRNRVTGRLVQGIIPVHILGNSVEMDPVTELSAEFGLTVIEDATEALGCSHRNQHAGTRGLSGCFSFNGNKMITTGGGGMVTSNDPEFTESIRHLSTQAKLDPVEYIHDQIGFNYRLTNIQAAMGCAQLERLPQFLARKQTIAGRYDEAFAGLEINLPQTTTGTLPACWMYTVCIPGGSRPLITYLKNYGIQTRPLWCPMHLLEYFSGAYSHHLEHSAFIYENGISLPCSSGLTDEQQEYVIDKISSFLN